MAQNIINPSNPADRVASDLIQAYKTSSTKRAFVAIGKCEVTVDGWGDTEAARVQVNWPSIGPSHPREALLFSIDLSKASAVAAIVDLTLNIRSIEI